MYINKTTGNNLIETADEADTIYSGAGDDTINAGDGLWNFIQAGDGNNTVTAGKGNDTVYTGKGNDTIDVGRGYNIVNAGAGNNLITAAWGYHNAIYTYSGNDTVSVGNAYCYNYINVGAGNNTVNGGRGKDHIYAENGDDIVNAGDGNNIISVAAGKNTITAGIGNDYVYAYNGENTVNVGAGDNYVDVNNCNTGANNSVVSGDGNDTIIAGSGADTIDAQGGYNYVYASSGANNITTGNEDDHIYGFNGSNTINAGNGNNYIDANGNNGEVNTVTTGSGYDTITAGTGDDVINAGEGKNWINARSGNNKITSGNGNDTIYAEGGNDTIYAGNGNNTVYAGNGANIITTGTGTDYIISGNGDDVITTGGGSDTIHAGHGNDTLIFSGVNGAGFNSYFDGDGEVDTLVLQLTSAQQADPLFQSELAAYQALLAAGKGGGRFTFTSLGLLAHDIEKVVVETVADAPVVFKPANDTVTGTHGDDVVNVGEGNNWINAYEGTNVITAGQGNDTVYAHNGINTINAGAGDNFIDAGCASSAENNITTGNGDDVIYTGHGDDVINAGDGKNYINAHTGTNIITTGNNNDTILAYGGINTINAGDGINYIYADNGYGVVSTSNIVTGSGRDYIVTGNGDDTINAGDGDNYIDADDGNNYITTGSGNDRIDTDDDDDIINAGDGNNWVDADGGNNIINTGSGNDTIDAIDCGHIGNNIVNSGAGNDFIVTGYGNDTINVGSGDNILYAYGGNDTLNYTFAEGIDAKNCLDGGESCDPKSDNDTVNMYFTQDELARADVQADIAGYKAFLASHKCGAYTFTSQDLTLVNWENFNVILRNDAPVIDNSVPLQITGTEDTALSDLYAKLLATATDPNGDTLSIQSITGLAHGTLANGVYTPNPNWSGEETITYTVTDGNGGLATGTATINVTPVADAPVVTLVRDALTLTVNASLTDTDGSEKLSPIILTGLDPRLALSAGTYDPMLNTYTIDSQDWGKVITIYSREALDVNEKLTLEPQQLVATTKSIETDNDVTASATTALDMPQLILSSDLPTQERITTSITSELNTEFYLNSGDDDASISTAVTTFNGLTLDGGSDTDTLIFGYNQKLDFTTSDLTIKNFEVLDLSNTSANEVTLSVDTLLMNHNVSDINSTPDLFVKAGTNDTVNIGINDWLHNSGLFGSVDVGGVSYDIYVSKSNLAASLYIQQGAMVI